MTFDVGSVAYDPTDGAQIWITTFDSGRNDRAMAMAISPAGDRVFVAGSEDQIGSGVDVLTIGIDAGDGETLWASTFDGPAHHQDTASGLAVSPSGTRVFVTGTMDQTDGIADYGTLAYDAATGRRLWVARYDGPAGGVDFASALGVAPDGAQVYVTGTSFGVTTGPDYATVAYQAGSGQQAWVSRYDGPAGGEDQAVALAITPDGRAVIVTGVSKAGGHGLDFATVAYGA
jgi:DNA-binding beta-propeller fold protein YncE